MKIIDWSIYLLGLFLLGTTLHELYHFVDCGGSFVAGIAWLEERLIVGTTWCERGTSGELIPRIGEIGIWVVGITLKVRLTDKPKLIW